MGITRSTFSTLGVTGSGTSVATTWGTAPATGSKVLVGVQYSGPASDLTVKDNGSPQTTLTLDGTSAGSGTAPPVYVYRGDNVTPSGTYTVTVTSTGSAHTMQAGAGAYADVKAGGPTSSNNPNGTGTAVSTGNATPGFAGALFFAVFFDASSSGSETITLTGSGFTEQFTQVNGSSFWAGGIADKIDAGGPAATACTWTLGDSVGWNALIVAYDVAATVIAAADTGSGAEAAAVSATVSGADTGSGAEAAVVHATVSGADTGSGAEAAFPGIPGADTGTGAESAVVTQIYAGADGAVAFESAAVTVIREAPVILPAGSPAGAPAGGDGTPVILPPSSPA